MTDVPAEIATWTARPHGPYRVLGVALAATVALWIGVPAAGATGGPTTSSTTAPVAAPPPAKAEILVDVNTGRALLGENEHQPLPPGSLTKMLTAMIAIDWLTPAAQIPVSAGAASVYPDRVGMKVGQRWTLSVSLHALLIFSANDAAYALAERVGGSLPGFAAIMRRAAAQLGMSDRPVLNDPAGLDGTEGYAGGNRISAWDLAIAGRDLMANPALASIVALKHYRFTAPDRIVHDLTNKNLVFLNTYPGAIGIKTGFTDAGRLLRGRGSRPGRADHAGRRPERDELLCRPRPACSTRASPPRRAPRPGISLLPPPRQPEPARPAPRPPPTTDPPATPAPVTPAPLVAAGPAAVQPSASGTSPLMLAIVAAGAGAGVVIAGGVWYRRPGAGHDDDRPAPHSRTVVATRPTHVLGPLGAGADERHHGPQFGARPSRWGEPGPPRAAG